jgi:hypothetical protein
MLFLVSNGSEIKHLKALIIVIGELLIVGTVLWKFCLFYCFVGGLNLEIVLAGKLNQAVPLFVVDDDQNLLVAKAAQLDCFLQKPSLSFAKSHISLQLIVNQS